MLLQQYLPFTVLKLTNVSSDTEAMFVATVLTVYGIETLLQFQHHIFFFCCNSTYRLRY